MLSILQYIHPYITISYPSNPLPIFCCRSHTLYILISPLPHDQLPINSFTNIKLSISHSKHPYVTPPSRSVTNKFYYQYYAVHLTLNLSFCHPSHTISYQSIPLQMLCCPSHSINILMTPLSQNQLSINSITSIMLSISQYKHPYVTPPTRSVTNQFHYQYYAFYLILYSSLCHPSRKISYQSISLPILCCLSNTKYILMSPLPHYQLPINCITNFMLSISH
jgi:hypothetical protein